MSTISGGKWGISGCKESKVFEVHITVEDARCNDNYILVLETPSFASFKIRDSFDGDFEPLVGEFCHL